MILLEGLPAFVEGVRRKNAQMDAAVRMAVGRALHMIERRTKQTLTTSSHPPGTATPSQPGEPPSLVTGNLRRSITVTGPQSAGSGRWRGEVGPTAIYGRIQELGGEARGRTLPARPYLAPSYEALKPELERVYRELVTAAILK